MHFQKFCFNIAHIALQSFCLCVCACVYHVMMALKNKFETIFSLFSVFYFPCSATIKHWIFLLIESYREFSFETICILWKFLILKIFVFYEYWYCLGFLSLPGSFIFQYRKRLFFTFKICLEFKKCILLCFITIVFICVCFTCLICKITCLCFFPFFLINIDVSV